MRIKFKNKYLIGISVGFAIVLADIIFFLKTKWFISLIILALTAAWAQFWIDFFNETKRQKEIELKFLEFIRSLVGTVKSGIPVPNAILHVADEDYGELSPYVKKLANQIEWGVPIHQALINFSDDTANSVIKRSVSIVIEADKSGGDISDILESVSMSVFNIKRLKEERKSSTHSQIVQGYIVFFIFIAIMLVMQVWLGPQLKSIGGSDVNFGDTGFLPGFGGNAANEKPVDLDRVFFSLVVVQGFFTGIMIGKFSEGNIKQGLLHALILITSATLIITLVKGGI